MKPATNAPEWQIDFPEFLGRLQLTTSKFEDIVQLPKAEILRKVIPLKDLSNLSAITPISSELFHRLLVNVKTLDGQEPFHSAKFRLHKVDPRQLLIGQKFAYRENYCGMLENLSDLFQGKYMINCGITDLGAYIVFGEGADGQKAISIYLPPIVEHHNGELVIMDGIHRNFIALRMGATITAIIATGVSVKFPCSPRSWRELRVISQTEKPKALTDRFFELNQGGFRDLKHFGIDG